MIDLHIGRPSDQDVKSWIKDRYGTINIFDDHIFHAVDALQEVVDLDTKAHLPLYTGKAGPHAHQGLERNYELWRSHLNDEDEGPTALAIEEAGTMRKMWIRGETVNRLVLALDVQAPEETSNLFKGLCEGNRQETSQALSALFDSFGREVTTALIEDGEQNERQLFERILTVTQDWDGVNEYVNKSKSSLPNPFAAVRSDRRSALELDMSKISLSGLDHNSIMDWTINDTEDKYPAEKKKLAMRHYVQWWMSQPKVGSSLGDTGSSKRGGSSKFSLKSTREATKKAARSYTVVFQDAETEAGAY